MDSLESADPGYSYKHFIHFHSLRSVDKSVCVCVCGGGGGGGPDKY